MKFTDLTREQKNIWIAEKLDPNPKWTTKLKSREYLGWFYSDRKCWERQYEGGEIVKEQACNFHTDHAMRDLLQEKLLEMGFTVELWPWEGKVLIVISNKLNSYFQVVYGTRESVWPDAFMFANGWTP